MKNGDARRTKAAGWAGGLAAAWGLGGVLAILVYAVIRLAGRFLDAFAEPFSEIQWAVLVVNTVFMAYSEGYRGFQQSFAPRVVARAWTLVEQPTPLRAGLAPLFCMGFFHATRRRLIATYVLFFGVLVLILLIRLLPQPWRGILDFGVVVGLSWGILSILAFALKALRGRSFDVSPALPGAEGLPPAAAALEPTPRH